MLRQCGCNTEPDTCCDEFEASCCPMPFGVKHAADHWCSVLERYLSDLLFSLLYMFHPDAASIDMEGNNLLVSSSVQLALLSHMFLVTYKSVPGSNLKGSGERRFECKFLVVNMYLVRLFVSHDLVVTCPEYCFVFIDLLVQSFILLHEPPWAVCSFHGLLFWDILIDVLTSPADPIFTLSKKLCWLEMCGPLNFLTSSVSLLWFVWRSMYLRVVRHGADAVPVLSPQTCSFSCRLRTLMIGNFQFYFTQPESPQNAPFSSLRV